MSKYTLDNKSWITIDTIPKDLTYNFDDLWNLHPEEYGKIKFMGETISTPRYQQQYGKSYWFSGMKHEALPVPEILKPFLEWVNTLNYGDFDGSLLNWYKNGAHYIGKHSDDESNLVKGSAIIAISLGESRKFRIRCKKTDKIIQDINLFDRSYIVMGGQMQKNYTHEIVKINGKKGENTGKRISLTFRQFK